MAVPMQSQFLRFTLDSIAAIAMGVDLNSLAASEDSMPDFVRAFESLQDNLVYRGFTPFWKYIPWLLKSEREIAKSMKILHSFYADIISTTRNSSDVQTRGDILSLFTQLEDSRLNENMLRDILLSFLIAGRDTTACSLSFSMFLLATHSDIQEKAFEEVYQISGGKKVTIGILSKLPYVQGVVFEALRLFPPIPFDMKQAVKADVLPGGHPIPAGTLVAWDT